MDNKTFENFVEDRIALIRKVLKSKGKEYSPHTDRLHNFRRAATLRKTTPEDALLGMKVKHTVSIEDIVENVKQGKLPTIELLAEKIGDEINYWIILEIIIKEKILNK
jgi:hypothetical protein